MKMRIMALPYGLLGLAWGLAWLGLMAALMIVTWAVVYLKNTR